MPSDDAEELAQLAVRVRLLTAEQVAEFRDEDGKLGTAEEFMRAVERKGYLTPWQSHKLLRNDEDGYYLGNYRLLYKVGSGTYGRVFRAEDPQTGMVVAIKVLRDRWNNESKYIEAFEKEAKVGLSLRHPNIVTNLYMGRDQHTQRYYFVMDFVEGGNLRDFLGIRKKLEAAEALRIMEDVTAGMAYAYSRGVTHRDMKLSNVLISTQGVAKLVDFGLAGKALIPGRGDALADRSVDYAGLEMATHVPPNDVRSDIYFMGCVLYEMLTGHSPLSMSRDRNVRMSRERFERVPPISGMEVEAPHSVFQLVETMMSLNPVRRYQNPSQLLGAIRSARADVESHHGKRGGAAATAAPNQEEATVFVIEKNLRLQEVLRETLKKMGYRVLLSINPDNALTRFRQKPFQAVIMDLETVGEEALIDLETIMKEAERHKLNCAGIVILGEDQGRLKKRVPEFPKVAVMQRPLNSKQLREKLRELAPPPGNHKDDHDHGEV